MKDNTPKTVDEILDTMLDKQVLVNKIGQQPFDEAKQQIYELVREVIGEDEQKSEPGHTYKEEHRNELRAEIHVKLNELFNKGAKQ